MGRLQPCGCGYPLSPSLPIYLGPEREFNTEPSRSATSGGPAQHSPTLLPRHLSTLHRSPPTCGSSPFGKDLGVGSRWWASFSFCWSRALFPRVSSWHVTRKSISKQAGPPGLTIRPSGAGLPTVPACLAGEVCQAHTMGPHLALGPCPNVFFKVIRVPAGVETGTDVPARGNGLISCRPFHTRPRPPYPPSECFSM